MPRIFETIFDANDVMVSRQVLGAFFLDRVTAASFLDVHLPSAFPNGKTGYDCDGDYWWGCSLHADTMIHHYTIEE